MPFQPVARTLSLSVLMASTIAVASESAPPAMEELVVTGQLSAFGATRSATPILETSRSVSVISQDEFRARGALTLDDALTFTAGVTGDAFGFSTRGDFASVRGFDAAEYRDGQQVLFGFYNNTRSDIYMLEQVEVLKGPASVLFGKGTPGGIINASSKLARPDVESEVLLDIGDEDRRQLSVDYGTHLGGNVYARLVGIYRDADTQVNFVNDDALILMPSITWTDGRTRLTAMVEYADRDSDTSNQFLPLTGTACVDGAVTVSPATICANANGERIAYDAYMGEPGFNRYDTTSTLVSLLGSHVFNDVMSLDAVVRYKDGEADYRQAWISFTGAGFPRVNDDGVGPRSFYISEAGSEQLAIDLRTRFDFDTGPLNHEIFVGAFWQDVETDNDSLFLYGQGQFDTYAPVYGFVPAAITAGASVADGPASQTDDLGFYVNDQISIGGWKLNLGARFDDTETRSATTSQSDQETSLSIGLLYAFESGFSPYASWAESFQPVVGLNTATGEPLKPRQGEQFELGVKYQPPGTRTYVTLAWFDIEETNLPNPSALVTSPDQQQEGVGSVDGFEIEAQTRIGDWSLEGNFTLLNTRSAEGVPFDSTPEEMVSLWVQYEPSRGRLQGLRTGVGMRYAGGNESNDVPAGVRVTTDGYTVFDALVGYTLGQWDFTLNLRNLADDNYQSTCLARGDCFPSEDRSILGRLAWRM